MTGSVARFGYATPESTARTGSLLSPIVLSVLMASCFLPYVHKGLGIRFENLLTTALAVVALLAVLLRGRLQRALTPILVVSLILFLQVALATALGDTDRTLLKVGLGRLDHYFRPVSILLIASVAYHGVDRADRERAFWSCARVLLFGVSLNALVQIASLFTDVSVIVGPFRPDVIGTNLMGLTVTVAEMAAQNSRMTGIFNQPLEHGLVYGLALLVCVHAWRQGAVSRPFLLAATTLVSIGGVLAISKVFLLGAVPLAVLLAVMQGGLRLRHVAGAVVTLAVVVLVGRFIFMRWEGAGGVLGLLSMLRDPQFVLYALSGGRVGAGQLEEEFLVEKMLVVFRKSPLFGVGTASPDLFGDNEYLMALAESGLIGLGLLLVRLVLMAWPAIQRLGREPAALMLGAVVLLAAGGGMGGPVSGIPRSGTALWVVYAQLALVITAPRVDRRGDHGRQ